MIPYMTYDRMKWADRKLRKEGERMTRDWAAVSPTLAWYDYIYGKQYCVPRVWFHEMASYYRFGQRHNVRCSYAEAYPSSDWREGPKLYISFKLLWNPRQDVDALLEDWRRCAVGPDAAPVLAEYYRFWEEFWTGPVLETDWFEERRSKQYLNFKTTGYLEALTVDELNRCGDLLSAVVAKARTDPQKRRAEKFLADFLEWSAPLPAEIERLRNEKATRALAAEQQARLAELARLKGGEFLAATAAYREQLAASLKHEYTNAVNLQLGLLLENAGQAGAWSAALRQSPWAQAGAPWLQQFAENVDAGALLAKESLTVLRTPQPPRIDGTLEEPCWSAAAKAGGFTEYRRNTMMSEPTLAAAAYDSENLYLAYLCLRRGGQPLKAAGGKHDGPVWRDECIEFFVAPGAEGKDYYQLIVNPRGTTYDALGFRKDKWEPKSRVGIRKHDLFWTVEIAIPLGALPAPRPAPGAVWRANLTRASMHFTELNIGAWRFADGANNDVARFGRLLFK